jgi:hypothetical protein
MTSLIVKVHNEHDKNVLINFLNSLNYEYYEHLTTDKSDTTGYLLSGESMKKHLEESIKEAGKVKSVPLNDLWK